jgi:hypothetical protein
MNTRNRRVVVGLLGALVLCVSGGASAVTISFQATDLADVVVGQDLWRYDYSVSGSFVQFGGFNILFSPALYSNLENPSPAVNADWLVSTTEPDAGLPADGLYTATALVSNPSLADLFALTFVWLGSETPGSQPFEVFDDTFSVLQPGQTQTPNQVPLPGTAALLAAGLLAFTVRRIRNTSRNR